MSDWVSERGQEEEFTTEGTEFHRENPNAEFLDEFDGSRDWEELLAQAEAVLQDADSGFLGASRLGMAKNEARPGMTNGKEPSAPQFETGERLDRVDENARMRRIYRGRTIAMLRRYMRYSIETGRLPSIVGREFFRSKVTSYTVVTFEDRVIFVHDMETCLTKMDEFSQQLIARHILQEHDRCATAKLLHCNEKTVRRLTPIALDVLSEIMLDVGLMDRLKWDPRKSCQGGFESQNFASNSEQ